MVTQTNARREGDVEIFGISGRLALGNTLMGIEDHLKHLVDKGEKKLILDLGSLTAIDSAGIGMIIMIAGAMDQKGGRMKIAGAAGLVQRSFDIVHLDRVVQQYPDVEAAMASFSADAAGAKGAK